MRDLRLEMPEPVAIDYPVSQWGTSSQTMLFRRHTYLPFAIKMARERAGEGQPLSVVSAGSSNGAEIYSLLALNRASQDVRDISIRGYDVKSELLVEALRGVYLAYDQSRAADLERLGFRTAPASDRETPSQGYVLGMGRSMLRVDATPLREDCALDLVRHDVTESLPDPGGRHLVLANNLLYHLYPEEVVQTARNLASVLSDEGIISFGKDGIAYDSTDARGVAGMLREEFRLVPLFDDADGNPVMFGRA
jgi:chemotaxis methyl-accepting protein methylase